jgi:Porin subfamily
MKAILLATAAGLAVAGGAQAADLPVKARGVQYVKICSLYGDGYYYIPGSDTCIRIGGYVRAQYGYNAGGGAAGAGIVPGTSLTVTDGLMTRQTAHFSTAHRADLTIDTRTQTQYGTLRTYTDLRIENRLNLDAAAVTRAFIQWGGFTVGRSRSYFDIFTFDQRLSYLNARTTGDTLDLGINLGAYTVQFAPGVTLSISAEDAARQPVTTGVADGTTNVFAVNAATTLNAHGISYPDIIGNLRVDQAWGYVGFSVAAHANQARHYGTPDITTNNYPSDKWGWAAAVGGEVNLPWGDTIGANFVYSLGASAYATRSGSWQLYGSNQVGVGWLVDGLFDTGTAIELTRVWSINAAYQRRWSPNWATSVYGGYVDVSYNSAAKTIIARHLPGAAGSNVCGVPVAGAVWPPVNIPTGSSGAICNPDFSFMQVGTRTQWTPIVGFAIGVDIAYTKLFTAHKGTAPGLYPAVGTRPSTATIDDTDVWSGIIRVQRSFNTQ